MKVIVLNSLSHSGSTVLSMVLSASKNAISLGEIYQILRDEPSKWLDNNESCSCSQSTEHCDFWGPVLRHIQTHQIHDINERYQYALQYFATHYGDDSILIDTSKGDKHLDIYRRIKVDYKLIYLLRDVRSFAFSQSKVAARQKRKGLKKIKGQVWFQFLKWYFGNKKRLKKFNSAAIKYFQMGYEDFCFNQNDRLKDLCHFLEIPFDPEYLSMTNATHHVLMGNPMRHQKDKQSAIKYDSSWLSDTRNALPCAIFPFIIAYNKKHVYQK